MLQSYDRWLDRNRFMEVGADASAVDMTSLVADVYRDHGRELPDGVTGEALRQIAGVQIDAVDNELVLRELIPALYVASMARDLNERDRLVLRAAYRSWFPLAQSEGPGVIGLAVTARLSFVASRLNEPALEVSPAFKDEFEAYIGSVSYDPQTYYYARQLNLVPEADLEYFSFRRMGPAGWLATVSMPDLDSTYRAGLVFAACGGDMRLADAQIEEWAAVASDDRSQLQLCFLRALTVEKVSKPLAACDGEWDNFSRHASSKGDGLITDRLLQLSDLDNFTVDELLPYATGDGYSLTTDAHQADLIGTSLVSVLSGDSADQRRSYLTHFALDSLWQLEATESGTTLVSLTYAVVLASGEKDLGRAALVL